MKRSILFLGIFLAANIMLAQTTATNFTANDCSGNSHTLFSHLDSGKVVVIAWVMPCGSCIGPAKTAYTAAQSFATSHPGRVLYFLADDYANTTCATLNSWASTNAMPNAITISNSSVSMSNYGTPGMPKVVVLGGTSHTIYLNMNSGVTNTNVTAAINSALAATGINDVKEPDFQINVFPNPVTDKLSVSYTLTQAENIKLEIVNILGENIQMVLNENQPAGQHELSINTENMSAGVYLFKVSSDTSSQLFKFAVSH